MAHILMLNARHEQNAPNRSVRLAGFEDANLRLPAAGVAALWDPTHGEANEAVLKMLAEIGRSENIPAAMEAKGR